MLLADEVSGFVGRCRRAGRRPAVRLNGTSDIPWERLCPELFEALSEVQFYDYTKDPRRPNHTPPNYYLNFSRDSEVNEADCLRLLARGVNCTLVSDLPGAFLEAGRYRGFPVIDGDLTDLRFTDPPGCWVVLKAKGRARGDRSGFVVNLT